MAPQTAFRFMRPGLRFVAAAPLVLALAGQAAAQSMSVNSASYNAGYGRTPGQENRGIDVSTRDSAGNRTIVNGIIDTGVQTVSSTVAGGGVSGAYSGVGGGGGSLAVGNSLNVVTQGNYNTVIVNSTQINNGDVTAVSGGVGR